MSCLISTVLRNTHIGSWVVLPQYTKTVGVAHCRYLRRFLKRENKKRNGRTTQSCAMDFIFNCSRPTPRRPPQTAVFEGAIAIGRANECDDEKPHNDKISHQWQPQIPTSSISRQGFAVATGGKSSRCDRNSPSIS